MYIVVIGGGSVGLLLAARLAAGGQTVRLVTRSAEQAERIGRKGILLRLTDGQTAHVTIEAVPAFRSVPEAEVYLLAVKQTDLPDTLPLLDKLPRAARLIALQNGMGHAELLTRAVSPERLFLAVNTEGARRLSDTEVEHTGKGTLTLGPWLRKVGTDPLVLAFSAVARQSGIDVNYTEDIRPALWRKLLANAVINPLTAIHEVHNGFLVETALLTPVMRALFMEAARVANAEGQKIIEVDWQEILTICRNTSRNYSSMLQDLWNGKMTEVESINGYIVSKANVHGVPVPTHETVLRIILAKTSPGQPRRDRR